VFYLNSILKPSQHDKHTGLAMKIHQNIPVNSKTTHKTKRHSSTGAFGQLLDANSEQLSTTEPEQARQGTPATVTQAPMQEAWRTLESSVFLLDEAMHCIESGDNPPHTLIHDIEQLRALLRQQVGSGNAALELKQADTLLAVEAERIRTMQS